VYPTVDETGQVVGGLRTADAVSEVITGELVLGSLIMFGLIYGLLFVLWVFLLDRAIRQGPGEVKTATEALSSGDTLSAVAARASHGESLGGTSGEDSY
jgi:cytochrome d ubiquinol oxidase subunit I